MTDAALRPSHLPDLELHTPTSEAELTALVAAGCCPIGGGSDVLLAAAHSGTPHRLVSTALLDGFGELHMDTDEVTIGAAVTLGRLVRDDTLRSAAPALADGVHKIGSVQLRNTATLVGNLCTASPAGDTIPGLFVHNAVVDTVDSSGVRRSIEVADFTTGPGLNALASDEVVTAVRVQSRATGEGSAYHRFTERNAIDLAFAGVAARLAVEPDGETVRMMRLGLGAVGPSVVDASAEAAVLIGDTLDEGRTQEVADASAEACSPISDHRCSADFRRQLIRVLTLEAIERAASRALEGHRHDRGQR